MRPAKGYVPEQPPSRWQLAVLLRWFKHALWQLTMQTGSHMRSYRSVVTQQ